MMTCEQITTLCTEFEEGTLSWKQWGQFRVHIAICAPCMEYVQQMRITSEVLGSQAPPEVDPATRTKLTEIFRDWHSEHEEPLNREPSEEE